MDSLKLVGTKEVHIVCRFKTPPNLTAEQAGLMIAQNGISVAVGLVEYMIGKPTAHVVDATPGDITGKKLKM